MKSFRYVFLFAVLTLTSVMSAAQQPIRQEFDASLGRLAGKVKAVKSSSDPAATQESKIKQELDEVTNIKVYALALAIVTSQNQFVQKIEGARIDKQVGTTSASSGSTSLVAKGSVPSILGIAVENGAIEKSTSGTSITFRGNPVGIIKALGDKGFIDSYDDDDRTTRFLRRFSFAVTFDTNRGPQPGTFTGSNQQISSYSLHADLVNKRDPRNKAYKEKWQSLISTAGLGLTFDTARIQSFFDPNDPKFEPQLMAWVRATQDAAVKATAADVDTVLGKQFGEKAREVAVGPELKVILESYATNVNSFLNDRGALLKEVGKGPIVAFEYTNNRPGNQPNYSNFNLIGEFSPFNGRTDLTANASFSTFSTKPVGVTRTARDFQLSGQLDVPLGDIAKTGPFIFTMSGKYQHVFSDITTIGTTLTTLKKGDIGIGQFKFTIPVKGSGVKIPLSVTFSNRTEFIKESKIRGNIGVTFDLDTIFSKLKP